MSKLWPTNILNETTQLVAESCEHFVLVLDGFYDQIVRIAQGNAGFTGLTVEEGDQLFSGTVWAQCEGYGGQPANSVEA